MKSVMMWAFVSAVTHDEDYTAMTAQRITTWCAAVSLAALITAALIPAGFSVCSVYALEAGRAGAGGGTKEPGRATPEQQQEGLLIRKDSETHRQTEPLKEFKPSEKIKADKEVDFPSDI